MDYGTAWTGGFTLEELERYERIILKDGERTYDRYIVRMTVLFATGATQVHDGKASIEELFKEGDLPNLGWEQTGGKGKSPYPNSRLADILRDDDVTRKSGIYEYLLSGGERERALSIRAFTETQKRAAYERQHGLCAICHQPFPYEQMEGDHITPWHSGGHTDPANLQMLCRPCNRRKSGN